MGYPTPDGQHSNSHRHTGRAGERRISNNTVTSSSKRPVQAHGGSSAQYRNIRAQRARGADGYRLNSKPRRHGGLINHVLSNPRLLVLSLLAIAVLLGLIILLFFRISSCSNANVEREEEKTDERVSLSISSELADELSSRLDQNETFATIVKEADAVGNPELVELALRENDAIDYVAGFVGDNTPTDAKPFNENVSKGYYPTLYAWDVRWGYLTYADRPMGLSGSGPTTLAMAYMGLTGKNDQTPDSIAKKATQAKGTDATYDTSAEFILSAAKEFGLETEKIDLTKEEISDYIESGTALIVQLRAETLTDTAHWALVTGRNLDGSVNLHDPTSTSVTEHPWSPKTISSNAQAIYSVTLKATTNNEAE